VDLKHLSHLVALDDERHFARAAQRVHLSQPAFSRSIQAAEQALGLRLFDREVGEVRPTPAASFLLPRARRLLLEARHLQHEAALLRDGQLGDLAFGAGPFPGETLAPRLMAQLRVAHPQVRIRFEKNNWQSLLQRLFDESIEFFVADHRDIPADARIQVMPLGRDRGRLFVRQGHPLAGRTCQLSEAWAYGLAGPKLPQAMHALLVRLLGLPHAEDAVMALECDEVPLLRQVALNTDTVVVCSELALRDEAQAGRLLPLDVHGLPDVGADMGIVLLRHRTPSPMAQRAIEALWQLARSLGIPTLPDSPYGPAPFGGVAAARP